LFELSIFYLSNLFSPDGTVIITGMDVRNIWTDTERNITIYNWNGNCHWPHLAQQTNQRGDIFYATVDIAR